MYPDNKTKESTATSLFYSVTLLAFILSGSTGFFFRWQLASGVYLWPAEYLRHAHSHLMMFGWLTPQLLFHLYVRVQGEVDRKAIFFVAPSFAGILAYFSFLFSGYNRISFFNASLPLSVGLSVLNMLLWYPPIFLILKESKLRRNFGMVYIAIIAILLSTAVLWLFPLFLKNARTEQDYLRPVHLFLTIFSDGWPIFAVLAIAEGQLQKTSRIALWGCGIALIVTPVYGWFSTDVISCSQQNYDVAVKLSFFVYGIALIPAWIHSVRSGAFNVPFLIIATFFLLKIFMAISMPLFSFCILSRLRIPYIHIGLLGVVSLFLFYKMREKIPFPLIQGMGIAVLFLLGSLIPVYWDIQLIPLQLAYRIATVAALFPVLIATFIFFSINRKWRLQKK